MAKTIDELNKRINIGMTIDDGLISMTPMSIHRELLAVRKISLAIVGALEIKSRACIIINDIFNFLLGSSG